MISKSIIRLAKSTFVLLALWAIVSCQRTEKKDMSFIALVVQDFERSLDWYSNTLGFEVIEKTENTERNLKQANLSYQDVRLEIIEIGSSIHPTSLLDGTQNRVIFQGIFKAGFSIDNFEEMVGKWQIDKVVSKDQVVTDPVSGKRMVILRDPDGNRIQIFEN